MQSLFFKSIINLRGSNGIIVHGLRREREYSSARKLEDTDSENSNNCRFQNRCSFFFEKGARKKVFWD